MLRIKLSFIEVEQVVMPLKDMVFEVVSKHGLQMLF